MTLIRTMFASLLLAALSQAAAAGSVTMARAAAGHLPSDAMPAGHDTDGRALYSCSAMHNGHFQPGRLGPDDTGCQIAFGGDTVRVDNYLVLTGLSSVWAAPRPGQTLPEGAFVAGGTRSAPLYACRAYAARGVFPGRLGAETGWLCIFTANGREGAGRDFDVLLR